MWELFLLRFEEFKELKRALNIGQYYRGFVNELSDPAKVFNTQIKSITDLKNIQGMDFIKSLSNITNKSIEDVIKSLENNEMGFLFDSFNKSSPAERRDTRQALEKDIPVESLSSSWLAYGSYVPNEGNSQTGYLYLTTKTQSKFKAGPTTINVWKEMITVRGVSKFESGKRVSGEYGAGTILNRSIPRSNWSKWNGTLPKSSANRYYENEISAEIGRAPVGI